MLVIDWKLLWRVRAPSETPSGPLMSVAHTACLCDRHPSGAFYTENKSISFSSSTLFLHVFEDAPDPAVNCYHAIPHQVSLFFKWEALRVARNALPVFLLLLIVTLGGPALFLRFSTISPTSSLLLAPGNDQPGSWVVWQSTFTLRQTGPLPLVDRVHSLNTLIFTLIFNMADGKLWWAECDPQAANWLRSGLYLSGYLSVFLGHGENCCLLRFTPQSLAGLQISWNLCQILLLFL